MAPADREPDSGVTSPSRGQLVGGQGDAAPMAGSDPSLAQLLYLEPYRFEFFAALRLIGDLAQEFPEVDEEVAYRTDAARFRAHQALSFPASEIWDVKPPEEPGGPIEMTVAFFGLTGPMGALPRSYSELVIERVRKGDRALKDFLDLFNHRLIQLFALAGEKYRFYLAYERAVRCERVRRLEGPRKVRGFLVEERKRIDPISQVLLDLAGLGTPLLRYRDSIRDAPSRRLDIADETFRFFAGHLAQQHRCAVNLERLLAGYFKIAAEVVQFVGSWVALPVEHQTSLPQPGALASQRPLPTLGENVVVGSRVWEAQGKFRIRLGPLLFAQFQDFLPEGVAYRKLAQLVRLFVGGALDFDVQPTLHGSEVPWCQLGAAGAYTSRLGWNTWIRNREMTGVVGDAVFLVQDAVSMGG